MPHILTRPIYWNNAFTFIVLNCSVPSIRPTLATAAITPILLLYQILPGGLARQGAGGEGRSGGRRKKEGEGELRIMISFAL